MPKADLTHTCDSQARAGLTIVYIMGTMGIGALLGLVALAYAKHEPSPVVLTTLAGVIGGVITGLPSLMARMSGHEVPQGTQDVNVTNEKENAVNVKETK